MTKTKTKTNYIDIPEDLEIDYTEVEKVLKEHALKDLKSFVKIFWDTAVPNELRWNWHMSVLCDEIQTVYERVFLRQPKDKDLVINVPPGTSKTKIMSVMATAWAFARMPGIKIFVGSYSDSAVIGISDEISIIMRSDMYQKFFPWVERRKGMDSKHEFRTSKNGQFYAFTIGGTITSKHADILVVDDPLNPKKAASEKELGTANRFMRHTLPSRKVDKEVTPTLLIMQRLHENDPSGELLSIEGDNIRHICLPAELSDLVKPEEYKKYYTNGLLDEVRLSSEVLAEFKRRMGSTEYSGQFEQNPTATGGNIVKKDWFKYITYDKFYEMRGKRPTHYFLDTAFTTDSNNDPSAIIGTCEINGDLYIFKGEKARLEFPDLIKFVPGWVKANLGNGESTVRIEPKANGISLYQTLKSSGENKKLNYVTTPSPKDDKATRLRSISAKVEAGRVILVHGHWNEEFIDEVCGFPNKSHDEYVDLLCYACDYHLGDNGKGWSLEELSGYL